MAKAEAQGRKPQKRLSQPVLLACILLAATALLLLLDACGLFDKKESLASTDVSVHVLDVGQGDSIYIHAGSTNVLIDAGEAEYGDTVVQYLEQHGVESLDYVIATHPHSDHIGGLPAVLDAFPVAQFLMSDLPEQSMPTTKTFENLLLAVEEKNLSITIAKPGTVYPLGDATLELLGPLGDDYDSLNNFSMVTMLRYGDTRFLFTGDMEDKAERELLKADALCHVDVLKVGHHGSSTSTKKKFLDAITPDYAVISCGDNSYNHPNADTVERLQKYTEHIYRTDLQGTVVCETDGRTVTLRTEREKGE